jgi:hypothetical protein
MRHVSPAALVTLVLATAGSRLALAHIELQSPTARFVQDSGGLKTAPCGSGMKTGVVTPLVAGQALVVSWKESVSHSGHYRIALSAHDADFVEPTSLTAPTTMPTWDLADGIPDKTGTQIYTQTVQVPSTPCTACVLQLLQVMGAGMDGSNSGPFSGVYHACADVSISAGGSDAATAPDAATDGKAAPDLSAGKADTAGASSGAGGAGGGTGAAGTGGGMANGGSAATGGTSASGGAASGGALSTGGTTTGSDPSNMTGGNAGTATGGAHASGGAATGNGGAAGSKATGGAPGHGGTTSAGSGGSGATPASGSSSGCQLGRNGSSSQSFGWPTLGLIAGLFFALRLRRRRFGDAPIGAMRSPLWMSSSSATVAIHTKLQPASTRAIERCR